MKKKPPVDEPDALQARIDKARGRPSSEDAGEGSSLGHAIALFMSMGLSFAGSLVASLMAGDYLVKRTGQQFWYFVALIVGLTSGVSVVWRLLQPLMKRPK